MSHTRAHTHSAQNFAGAAAAIEAKRKACIKAVKAAQRQLHMDDPTYRAMLEARTGHTSSTACTLAQLHVVLDWLRRAGAVNPKGVNSDGRRRSVPTAERAPLMAKVTALLHELSTVTGTTYTMAYADAICERQQWCTRVDFADPQTLHKLVGALSRTVRAKAAKAAATTNA